MKNRSWAGRLASAGRYLYQEGTVYIILAVLVAFFTLFNPVFLTRRNRYNLTPSSRTSSSRAWASALS